MYEIDIDHINNGGINNSQISSKKEINFKALNKGIVDSLIYSNDNINFNGNMNDGGIINSTIYAGDILNLNIMNKGIKDSYVYSKNNMNFGDFNGQAHIENSIIHTDDILNMHTFDATIKNGTVIYAKTRINLKYSQVLTTMNGKIEPNAFVCSGGSIADGIKAKETKNNGKSNVVEKVTFDQCLTLAGKSLTNKSDEVKPSNLSSILDSLKSSVDMADYKYK